MSLGEAVGTTTDRAPDAELAGKASAFERASALTPATPVSGATRSFLAEVPDGWQQGKGAFGGLVIGMMTRALVASEQDAERSLRAVNADLFVAGMPGPATVDVSVLRRGANVSFLEARLTQGGVLVARAGATLAAPRAIAPSPIARALPLPTVEPQPPWEDLPALPIEAPIGPVFARHYEYRSSGPLPFAGGERPFVTGWIRERERPRVLDEAAVVGLLDAWWPTTLSLETKPRATVTVGYTMQMVKSPRTLDPSVPLFYRAHGMGGGDNFFVEMRELWSGGEVVALNQQTFAMLT